MDEVVAGRQHSKVVGSGAMGVEALVRSLLLEVQARPCESSWLQGYFCSRSVGRVDFEWLCEVLPRVAEMAGPALEQLEVDEFDGFSGQLMFATAGTSWAITAAGVEEGATVRFESLLVEERNGLLADQRLVDPPVDPSSSAPNDLIERSVDVLHRYGLVGLSVATSRGAVSVGYLDLDVGRPLGRGTAIGCGSVTKAVVSVAALRLVSERRLDLDAPVASLVADLVRGPVAGVTARHLLTHTSGLGSDRGDLYTDRHDPDDLSCIDDLWQGDPPGQRESYSNAAFAVLGAVVRQVTGSSLSDALEDLVLWPLAMTSTRIASRADAVGYEARNGRPHPVPARVIANSAAGGLLTTAGDLCGFITGWQRLVSRDLAFEALMVRPPGESFALGWLIGPTRYGHTGGASGIAAAVSASHTNAQPVAVLTNRGHVPIGQILNDFVEFSD